MKPKPVNTVSAAMRALAVFGVFILAGCAGRAAAPVATTQASDQQLSCAQMLAEISANDSRSTALAAQEKSASNANVAIGVVGAVLFWPALFALDTGDAEKVEMAAYKSRNDHLNSVMRERDCRTGVAAPPAPAAPPIAAIPAPPPQPAAPHCAGGSCTAGDIQ